MVFTIATGKISDQELQAHQQALQDDPRFNADFVQLWDSRNAAPLESKSDAGNLTFVSSPNTHRAIVVSSQLSYGLGRQLELTRFEAHEGGLRIFLGMEDALAWIERTQSDLDAIIEADSWVDL